VRHYVGAGVGSPYRMLKIAGVADDMWNADGVETLSFAQAQSIALERKAAVIKASFESWVGGRGLNLIDMQPW
jgi:hypothetical protein